MRTYSYNILLILDRLLAFSQASENSKADTARILPVRGFCIAAPQSKELDEFIKFIDEELAPRSVNTLILRVDYNYQYESHPELSDSVALSKTEVKKLVAVCKKNNIDYYSTGKSAWDISRGQAISEIC